MNNNGIKFAAAMGMTVLLSLAPAGAYAASALLKTGMSGDEVVRLQKELKALGYLNADATGYYGQLTEEAVRILQARNGLAADGIAGGDTQALLDRLSGAQATTVSNEGGSSAVLKQSMTGDAVTSLQRDLKSLGFLDANATGFYGSLTASAVKALQQKYGLTQDGIAGRDTFSLIRSLLGDNRSVTLAAASSPAISRGGSTSGDYLVSWFNGASDIFSIGKIATVYDIDSGETFRLKRTYGTNHADSEPVTKEDTEIIKGIFGGSWSWERRAVIVDVDGRKMAASMAGMPHAGSESADANSVINSRSGGYGRGTNLDAVKGNNVSGVFDIHFLGSRTHGSNKVDSGHQAMIKKAAAWAEKNYR